MGSTHDIPYIPTKPQQPSRNDSTPPVEQAPKSLGEGETEEKTYQLMR